MIIVKILCCLVFAFGLFLLVTGFWISHQYQISINRRRETLFSRRTIAARKFVISFCLRHRCDKKEVQGYGVSCLFVGTIIVIVASKYLF